jgi:hypothetical protein
MKYEKTNHFLVLVSSDCIKMDDIDVPFVEVHYVTIEKIGDVPITKGDFQSLPRQVKAWLAQMVKENCCL